MVVVAGTEAQVTVQSPFVRAAVHGPVATETLLRLVPLAPAEKLNAAASFGALLPGHTGSAWGATGSSVGLTMSLTTAVLVVSGPIG
jgi:hypothetical protein